MNENEIAKGIIIEAVAQFRAKVEGSDQYADWEIRAIISGVCEEGSYWG